MPVNRNRTARKMALAYTLAAALAATLAAAALSAGASTAPTAASAAASDAASTAVSSARSGAWQLRLQVAAPDTQLDSMVQSASLAGPIGPQWQLHLRGSRRIGPELRFAGLEEAFVLHQRSVDPEGRTRLTLLVGRASPNWSPWQDTSVVLSGHAPGYDQLYWRYARDGVSFEKLLGQLSGTDRYLLAHRLTVSTGPWTGSLGEVAVASGRFVRHLANWLPWPYYWTQWVGMQNGLFTNNDVNANAFLQLTYRSPRGLLLGGELFVDDMPQTGVERQLYQLAGQLRVELPLGLQRRLSLQYQRVNNFTYTFQVSPGNYVHQGYVLGSRWGPDQDELKLTYHLAPPESSPADLALAGGPEPGGLTPVGHTEPGGLTELGLIVRRHGAGRIGDVWEDDGYDAGRDRQFLTGVVETSQLLYAAARYALAPEAQLRVQLGIGPIQNARNRLGYNKLRAEGTVQVTYAWGAP